MQKERFEFTYEYIPQEDATSDDYKKEKHHKKRGKKRSEGGLRAYRLHIFLILVIVIAVGVLFAAVFCPLKKLDIQGITNAMQPEVEEAILQDLELQNTVYLWVKSKIIKMPPVTFVESIKLTPVHLNEIQAVVTEKAFCGFVPKEDSGEYIYFNRDGMVTEITDRLIEGLPAVYGVEVGTPVMGEPIPIDSADTKTVLDIQKYLNKSQIQPDYYTFNEDGTCGFQCGGVYVELGTTDDLEEKVKRVPYILPDIQEEEGTLHLSLWNQEHPDVIFERN